MSPAGPLPPHEELVLRRGEGMGSQLRFDPSFFGLALRASAEADALLFSAHESLSGITRPTRAGLRLTSPAKASGEWPSMHKERIPLHKESGFLCIGRRARGKRSPAYHGMPRGGRQGEYTPRGYFGFPQTRRRERGGWGIMMHEEEGDRRARKRRARRGFGRAGRGAGKLLILY